MLTYLRPALLVFVACAASVDAQSSGGGTGGQETGGTSPTSATGFVFNDTNGNSTREEGEVGLPDVSVSNGLEVVQTDEQGRYELPVDEETILFISKPAGYMVPVNEVMLPQFYYIHQPNGTPEDLELDFDGIEPTGSLPDSVDFPLQASEVGESFEALAFADPQPRDDTELDYIRDDVVTEIVGTDAAFGLTVGDIMYDDLSLFERYNQIVAEIGIPFWNVPGNHDLNFQSPDDTYSLETYKRIYGPAYYSFDYGQVHFVVMDNVEYFGVEEGESGGYRGYIGNTQLAWLENDLRFVPEDKLIVLAMHIPLLDQGREGSANINTADREALFEVLAGRERVLSLAGHVHIKTEHSYFGEADGFRAPNPLHHITLTTLSGIWWGGPEDERGIPITTTGDGLPNGHHVLSFDGNRYREQLKGAGEAADYQLNISVAQAQQEGNTLDPAQWSAPQVVANVFNGSELSSVSYQIDGGEPQMMERTLRTDPYAAALYTRYPEEQREPIESSHIWTAPLPSNLAPGTHRVEVETTDQYGQTYQASRIFEIAEE